MASQFKFGERCPHCDLTYGSFRTGYTYQEVYDSLKSDEWSYKRRSRVLWAWCSIKLLLWAEHCYQGGCDEDPRNLAVTLAGVPF